MLVPQPTKELALSIRHPIHQVVSHTIPPFCRNFYLRYSDNKPKFFEETSQVKM